MDEAVSRIRSFNRLVTERSGALDDRYLAGRRPLGEARVLWEIGDNGAEVRRVRERLGLDSGYLSKLLRSLEVDPSHADARHCLTGYFAELGTRFDAGFDPPSGRHPPSMSSGGRLDCS